MEFKFRSKDAQASTYGSGSSGLSYFTEQALRIGYLDSDFSRGHEVFRNPTEFFRNPSNIREEIQRELEKERIREEITAAEIARKRVLEAEVRREMMIEREMGLRRADGFSFPSHRFGPRPPILYQSDGRSLEERIAFSLEERVGHSSGRDIGGFETVPFQHRVEPKNTEIKPKNILLGKRDANLSGVKRKATNPPATGDGELALVVLEKKPKEEWSCAICQINATSERALNEHLAGKKHKSKEAALTRKNFDIGLFPKETAKPTKLADVTDNPSSEQRGKNERNLRLLKFYSTESPMKKDMTLLQMQDADDSKKENGKPGQHKQKKFRFWCEMCQAGAFSEKVMNNHKRGKRHRTGLLELLQNGGASSGTQKVRGSEEVAEAETKQAKDLEAVAEYETRVVSEKVDGVVAEGRQKLLIIAASK